MFIYNSEKGKQSMKQDEFRQRLIDGAIRVIARDGLDKASAKQIELETGINVVYIYRCFKDKEDLFAKAFDHLDEELVSMTLKSFSVMNMTELPYVKRCRMYFNEVWHFLLGSRDKCLAFVRYFYSPYFAKYSAQDHRRRYQPLIGKMGTAFKEEADVWMILNHILNVMLDFAVKVHNGQMPDGDDYSEHVFRVIYVSVKQYFNKNEECDFPV